MKGQTRVQIFEARDLVTAKVTAIIDDEVNAASQLLDRGSKHGRVGLVANDDE